MNIVNPTWLGTFYGSDLSFDEYEIKTIEDLLPVSRAESLIINTRWFDYSRLHPLQATYYFVECYRRIISQLSQKYFGKPIYSKHKDFLKSREKNGYWMIRHFCDENGFCYPWFIYTMIEYRLNQGQFKNYIPRPQHLRPNEDELKALKQLWENKFNGELITASIDPYFTTPQWEDMPIQILHEDLIVNQIKKKRIKTYALSNLIYERKLLREERAVEEFPEDMKYVKKFPTNTK